ncbi:MAG: hypothetical protein GXY38_09240 [Planctomycetes bacterium]|nr:hypothetical protein [Planctomycetota bacterium]
MQVEDRHDADLSLILPTRGRHSMLKRFFASLIQTASRLSRLEVIMYMDDDDQQCPVADATHLQTHTVIGPRQTMGTMIRTCAAQARGRAFMLINDDAVFRTSGWDAAIADVLDTYEDGIVLVWCNDLFRRQTMPNFPVLSRKLCELMETICPSDYHRDYVDVHLFDIFQKLRALGHNRLAYLPDVVIEHLHHEAGKAQFDTTYRKPCMASDELAFIALNTRRELIAHRLAGQIRGVA